MMLKFGMEAELVNNKLEVTKIPKLSSISGQGISGDFLFDMGNQKGIVKEVEKVWLSIKETQNYLDCSRDYIYRLISEGKIRAARDGKMTFIRKDTVDKYLSSLVVTL